jgi:hypothetical protein
MSSDLMSGGTFGPEGGLCVTIVIVIAFIVLFATGRKKKEAPSEEMAEVSVEA